MKPPRSMSTSPAMSLPLQVSDDRLRYVAGDGARVGVFRQLLVIHVDLDKKTLALGHSDAGGAGATLQVGLAAVEPRVTRDLDLLEFGELRTVLVVTRDTVGVLQDRGAEAGAEDSVLRTPLARLASRVGFGLAGLGDIAG